MTWMKNKQLRSQGLSFLPPLVFQRPRQAKKRDPGNLLWTELKNFILILVYLQCFWLTLSSTLSLSDPSHPHRPFWHLFFGCIGNSSLYWMVGAPQRKLWKQCLIQYWPMTICAMLMVWKLPARTFLFQVHLAKCGNALLKLLTNCIFVIIKT